MRYYRNARKPPHGSLGLIVNHPKSVAEWNYENGRCVTLELIFMYPAKGDKNSIYVFFLNHVYSGMMYQGISPARVENTVFS